jgi:hypothetical protein
MKGNSDIYPKELVKSNNKVQARYNIVESKRTDENGKAIPGYDFNYVELSEKEDITKEAIAKAIESHPYFENEKQVILANEAAKIGTVSTKEYIEYTTKPTLAEAKAIAEKIDLTVLKDGKVG